MKKKRTGKGKPKQKMTVMHVPQYITQVARGVAEFSGVSMDDVVKVIFSLGIAWGNVAKSKDEKDKA